MTTKLPSGNAGRVRETIDASLDGARPRPRRPLAHPLAAERRRAAPTSGSSSSRSATPGLTRAIGVSNYDAAQIDEIIEATGVTPAVNQIKWSPALYDPVVVEAHRARGVVLEGYSPFKTSNLNDPVLRRSPSATASRRARSCCAGTSTTASS